MFRLLALLFALLFPADDPDSDPDPEPDPDPSSDPDPDPDPPGGDGGLDTDALQKELKKARDEAAKRRVQLRDTEKQMSALTEQNKAILKALGIDDGDDGSDLSTEVERLQTENKRLKMRQDFAAAAREAKADEDLTWGYLLARGELDRLEPGDDDYEETLQAMVAKAVESKPSLAITPTAPTPPRGGGDLGGGGGDGGVRQWTREDLVGKTAEQIEEAREKGHLKSLLAGTT